MKLQTADSDENNVLDFLKSLDARIARIEAYLELEKLSEPSQSEEQLPVSATSEEAEDALEFRIGQTWFAKVGIAVLAIGVAFLLTFPYQNLPPILPSLFGLALVGGIIALSHYWRTSYALVSRYLLGGAMLLLYFTTLRLHFFSPQPVVTEKSLLLGLLLAVVAANLFISIRRKSIYLTGLSLTMGYATAIVGGEAEFVFVMVTSLAALVVYFKLKYGWSGILFLGMLLSFLTHFVWAINNPFLGNDLHFVSSPQSNLFFILLYAALLTLGDLLRSKNITEDYRILLSSALNGFASYGLYLVLTLTSFRTDFGLHHILASCVFLGISVAFWMREKSKYGTFVYAMIGYFALSVAIMDQFRVPDNFIWLSWQTILVISTAVWFRSRFIVVANFVIYVVTFVAYLLFGGTVDLISVSFGFVALLSARILNWQKHRLELKTEMMRNAYLACAFFVFPYSLYHTMPSGYVSLSWVCVAVFYYVASLLLKSHKYRWMALLTLIITIAYVFVVDITRLEPVYRIASFLVLGIVLVAISLVYSRTKAKGRPVEAESGSSTNGHPDG